ncbi:MAG TPA: Hsp33 family molecular chaperone HslO [Pseudomonadales bacterium]|nr:Hsp33 family molecular chaperone HslO [Pseudomonadales bacterium]
MHKQADTVIRFILENRSVRGVWVRLQKSYQDVLANHQYDVPARQLLGESLAAAVVLSRTIKLQGRLALQARGEGVLRLLVAECTHDAGIRGILEFCGNPADVVAGTGDVLSLRQALGNGYLAVTLLPDDGDSYQGIVPLRGEKLQDCLAEYFLQSEQLATAMWFCCDGEQAVGLLLQALPAGDVETAAEDWQHIYTLASTITHKELLSLPCEDMLHRLFHEEDVRLFDGDPVRFQCTCSVERSRNALVLLGRDELQKIFAERDTVSVDCQFCGRHYQYTPEDMSGVLGEQPAQLH